MHATPGAEAETLAPISGSGVRVGTPGYMAPEQLLGGGGGGEADTRSDILAFGILLYELLAAPLASFRSSPAASLRRSASTDPQ